VGAGREVEGGEERVRQRPLLLQERREMGKICNSMTHWTHMSYENRSFGERAIAGVGG
jgi:hypothetical protein